MNSAFLCVNIATILAVIIAVLYRNLTTDLDLAVRVYKGLNQAFSDVTEFNQKVHHYLTGPYRPVQEENANLQLEVISGAFPADLEGLFLRVGPNPLPEKIGHGYHWFDGDGMLHSIRVQKRQAVYSNHYVRTPNYEHSKQHGGVVWVQLGELKGIVGILKLLYTQLILSKASKMTDLKAGAANTAINYYNHQIILGYEANLPFEIVWKENNTFLSKGYLDYNHTLDYPFTAHPKRDPEDGKWYFNGYSIDGASTMKYGKVSNDTIEAYFPIPLKIPTFAHDMSITRNYVVLYDSSIIFDKMEIFKEGLFYRLDDSKHFRIGLLPKTAVSAEEILWFTFDRAYGIVHPLNAWEEPETQEVVIVTPLSTAFNGFDSKKLPSKEELSFRMAEIRLQLETKEVKVQFLDQGGIVEFPNVHPGFVGRKTQFGFAGEVNETNGHFDKIVKYRLVPSPIREEAKIVLPENYVCGEPVIISRPLVAADKRKRSTSDRSDHVYVAVFATNLVTMVTDWIVYDGTTMSPNPVVRARIPGGRMVPLGFHGLWIHEADLQQHMQKHQV